jgi:dTDP-4-dehydrorhamnose reductase
MIFLLGASGYVGSGFRRELAKAWLPHRAISRVDLDYTKFRPLLEALRQYRPELVILCGGYTGRPTLYHCEDHRTDAILGNVALAQTVAQACDAAGVRLGVVSCGCVFAGAWVQSEGGAWVMRENLQTEDLALFLASHSARVRGFADDDTPNATFEHAGSFYAGTLAAMEKTLLPFPETYIWRFNVAFTERDFAATAAALELLHAPARRRDCLPPNLELRPARWPIQRRQPGLHEHSRFGDADPQASAPRLGSGFFARR